MTRTFATAAAFALATLLALPAAAQDASGTDETGTIAIDGELETLTAGFFTDATREELIPPEELGAAFAQMDAEQRTLVLDHCGEIAIGPDADPASGWAMLCEAVLTD
jgi:hypothetical protein